LGRPAQTSGRPAQTTTGDGRPHFTGRAAILAVLLCAVVLSLAYPVREYIAQRRQIDQLEVQRAQIATQLSRLEAQRQHLRSPAYIEQLARDRLHMCLPNQMCYVIINPTTRGVASAAPRRTEEPWYAKLWSSVRLADSQPATGHPAAGRRSAGRRSAGPQLRSRPAPGQPGGQRAGAADQSPPARAERG